MSVVEGLFGLGNLRQGVEQNLRSRDLELGTLIGQATSNQYAPQDRRNAYIQQQGAIGALGGMAIRGLGGLFGIEDPQLQRASSLEGVLQSTQQELGEEANDPTKFYPALQQKLMAGGFTREAAQVMDASSKLMGDFNLNQAKVGSENAQANKFKAETLKALREDDPQQKLFFKLAEKASPQSVKAAVEGGYDLALLDSPEVQKYSPDAQRLIDSGFVYGSPEFNAAMLDIIESDKAGKKKGSGTNVAVNLGGIDLGKMQESAGTAVGKKLADIPLQLKAKEALQGGIKQLSQGINSGFFANIKQIGTKATGGALGSQQKAENTEVYKSYIGNVVIPLMAQLGGSDSNEELRKMEAIVAGDITLEQKSMERILKSAQDAIDRDIERTKSQEKAAVGGQPAPVDNLPATPVATKRWNPKTGKLEVVK